MASCLSALHSVPIWIMLASNLAQVLAIACQNGGTPVEFADYCECGPQAYGETCEYLFAASHPCSNVAALPAIRDSVGAHAARNTTMCTAGASCIDFTALAPTWYRVVSPYGNYLVTSYPCTVFGASIGCGTLTPFTLRQQVQEPGQASTANGTLYSANAFQFDTSMDSCYDASLMPYRLRLLICPSNDIIYYLRKTTYSTHSYCIGIVSTITTTMTSSPTTTTTTTEKTTVLTSTATPTTTTILTTTTLRTTTSVPTTTTIPTTTTMPLTTTTMPLTTTTVPPTTTTIPPTTITLLPTTTTIPPTTITLLPTTTTIPPTTTTIPTTTTTIPTTTTTIPTTTTTIPTTTTMPTTTASQSTSSAPGGRIVRPDWNIVANDSNTRVRFDTATVAGLNGSGLTCSIRSNSHAQPNLRWTSPTLMVRTAYSADVLYCDFTAVVLWLNKSGRIYINCAAELIDSSGRSLSTAQVTVCQEQFRGRAVRYLDNRGQCAPQDDGSGTVPKLWQDWFGMDGSAQSGGAAARFAGLAAAVASGAAVLQLVGSAALTNC